MTKDDIDEAVWRLIAARLARDVMRRTDAAVIGEDLVKAHCMCAVRSLYEGLSTAYQFRVSGSGKAAPVTYRSAAE